MRAEWAWSHPAQPIPLWTTRLTTKPCKDPKRPIRGEDDLGRDLEAALKRHYVRRTLFFFFFPRSSAFLSSWLTRGSLKIPDWSADISGFGWLIWIILNPFAKRQASGLWWHNAEWAEPEDQTGRSRPIFMSFSLSFVYFFFRDDSL